MLGNTTSVFDAAWPSYDAALLVEPMVTMAVQVHGKTRGTIRVATTATQEEAMAAALARPEIAKFVIGVPTKVIFVPGRMLNILSS